MDGSMKHGSATLRSNLSWVVNLLHLIIGSFSFFVQLLWNCSDLVIYVDSMDNPEENKQTDVWMLF